MRPICQKTLTGEFKRRYAELIVVHGKTSKTSALIPEQICTQELEKQSQQRPSAYALLKKHELKFIDID